MFTVKHASGDGTTVRVVVVYQHTFDNQEQAQKLAHLLNRTLDSNQVLQDSIQKVVEG